MTIAELRALIESAAQSAQWRQAIEGVETLRRNIHTAAGDDPLNDDQSRDWDALDELEPRAREGLRVAEATERREEARRRFGSQGLLNRVDPFDGTDARAIHPREARDKALALVGDESRASWLRSDQRERLDGLFRANTQNVSGTYLARLALLTESELYREAWMQLMTRTQPVLTTEQARMVQEVNELRAMEGGTDAEGGFGVPVLIDPTIILTGQGHPNDILGLARIETITTDAWKGVSSTGVTWKFRDEEAAATDGSPTLAQPVVNVHRADGYIPYSFEVGQDYPGFAREMATLLDEGWNELVVEKLTVGAGDGSNEPYGIVTALDANTNVEIATTTAGTLGAVDINGAWAALPIRYRAPNARTAWMHSTDVNGTVQELGTTEGTFTVDMTAEGVTVLKGRRVYENDYMADMATGTAAANLTVVGDWRNFLVAQRAGMSVELIPHVFDTTTNMPTGQRAWFAWARIGADSINDLGFRMLQNKTS
jgi:HK97 family phage major capsid protein